MLKDDKNFECCPLAEVHLYKDKKTADKGSGKLQVKQVWAQNIFSNFLAELDHSNNLFATHSEVFR